MSLVMGVGNKDFILFAGERRMYKSRWRCSK